MRLLACDVGQAHKDVRLEPAPCALAVVEELRWLRGDREGLGLLEFGLDWYKHEVGASSVGYEALYALHLELHIVLLDASIVHPNHDVSAIDLTGMRREDGLEAWEA